MSKAKTAATYYRVSTEDQEQDGYGLKTQESACLSYVKTKGYKLVGEYTDVITGRTKERPGIADAIAAAETGAFDVLILFDHTRLGRDIDVNRQIRNELQTHGVLLEYVRGGDYDQQSRIGKVVDFISDWQAEGEIETMVDRSRPARRSAVEEGNLQLARRPFGYIINYSDAETGQSITPNPDEAGHVKQIFEWAAEGENGAEIARRLNQLGIYKPSGGEWIGRDVLRHLRRTIYKGEYIFGVTNVLDSMGNINLGREKDAKKVPAPEETWVRYEVPALVTPELWEQANVKLTARSRTHRPGLEHLYPFILRQRIFCGECGSKYHTDFQEAEHNPKLKETVFYYRHPTQGEIAGPCTNRNHFRRDDLEALVKPWIMEWVDNPEPDWDRLLGKVVNDNTFLSKEMRKVERDLDDLSRERPRLIRMRTKGQISEVEVDQQLERIETERATLEARLAEIEDELDTTVYIEIGKPREGWTIIPAEVFATLRRDYTPEEWQAVIDKYDVEIEITNDGEVWATFETSEESFLIGNHPQTWEVSNTPGPVA